MIAYVNRLGAAAPQAAALPDPAGVSVWSLDTTSDVVGGLRVADAERTLDAAERERAGRLVRPADRQRYRASHLGLRVLLGNALGLPPEAVELGREDCHCCGEPHGRPVVVGGGVRFSLSHSGDVAYVALAAVPVGVDVEAVPSAAAVADVLNTLHARETAELRALPEAARPPALARLWARKEAYLKATGAGLALGLAEPYVGSAQAPAPVAGWDLSDLPAPAGYAAALAVRENEPRAVRENAPQAARENRPHAVRENAPHAVGEAVPRAVRTAAPRAVRTAAPPAVGEAASDERR
ncbi:4'-phosphopantetheinyl transferase family protein [Streptomyces antimicrobicus]|uniref:4'-phosphopantetheinyl transferase superfamily protein n=1 Tax=Streptomyces antimicrobicus TaxID=2883108 RepID=A0ABS8B5F5_9ACTN|nr:4'-phosphopantetheinyl transferase superfamily protein [Streptomyces antimicrobicus]MCB5179845.1 4'-phosphopantetheinyl transferase superfamily protein [Streptomyces antimicrobicus]